MTAAVDVAARQGFLRLREVVRRRARRASASRSPRSWRRLRDRRRGPRRAASSAAGVSSDTTTTSSTATNSEAVRSTSSAGGVIRRHHRDRDRHGGVEFDRTPTVTCGRRGSRGSPREGRGRCASSRAPVPSCRASGRTGSGPSAPSFLDHGPHHEGGNRGSSLPGTTRTLTLVPMGCHVPVTSNDRKIRPYQKFPSLRAPAAAASRRGSRRRSRGPAGGASTYALGMSDPHAEIQLVVEWLRGAAGPLLPADAPAPDAPPATAGGERPAVLARLAAEVAACRRCGLGDQRTNAVFGEGSPTARLVVVGEAPGAEEDRTGRPFVGRAGELLTRMLAAIGLAREDVFICNVLKCRPPGNRAPRPDEAAACRPVPPGPARGARPRAPARPGRATPPGCCSGTERGITALRGRFHTTPEGWRVMPTFHPAYLLRNPAAKREAWEDLQKVAAGARAGDPAAVGRGKRRWPGGVREARDASMGRDDLRGAHEVRRTRASRALRARSPRRDAEEWALLERVPRRARLPPRARSTCPAAPVGSRERLLERGIPVRAADLSPADAARDRGAARPVGRGSSASWRSTSTATRTPSGSRRTSSSASASSTTCPGPRVAGGSSRTWPASPVATCSSPSTTP